jgi:plastocyanin
MKANNRVDAHAKGNKYMRNRVLLVLSALAAASALLAVLPAARAADIYGTIMFKGTPPPELDILPLKSDPTCGPMHQEMPTTHFYLVGSKGGFGDVVVSLKGIHGKSTGAEAKPLVIEQKGCEYFPYVSACQIGQRVIVKNLDPVLHNVHVTPENPGNLEENRAQLPRGPDLEFAFKAPETFLRFKCDVHPWMFAYVCVFDHPFFALTDKEGNYRIHNVSPGHYTLVATHRKAGFLEKSVDVQNQDVRLDFIFVSKAVS